MGDLRIENLLPILVFTLPGYVSIRVYDLFRSYRDRPVPRLCLDAVCYSALNFVVLAFPIRQWFNGKTSITSTPTAVPQTIAAFTGWDYWHAALVFILLPALWGLLAIWLGHTRLARRFGLMPVIPSAWDSMFAGQRGMFVRIRSVDGKLLGGLLGESSSASAFPAEPALYLERQWRLNAEGAFDCEVSGTAGLYVSMSQVAWLELLRIEDDRTDQGVHRRRKRGLFGCRAGQGRTKRTRAKAHATNVSKALVAEGEEDGEERRS